jgi:hypothetical protein
MTPSGKPFLELIHGFELLPRIDEIGVDMQHRDVQ